MRSLKLLIKQNPPSMTRFYVEYEGYWAAFNDFASLQDWLHSLECENLQEYVDLTEDPLSYEIDAAYQDLIKSRRLPQIC